MHPSKPFLQRCVVLLLGILLSSLFLTASEAAPMYHVDGLDFDIDEAIEQFQALPESEHIPLINLDGLDDRHAGPLQPGTQTGPQPGSFGSQHGQPIHPAAVQQQGWYQQPRSFATPYGGQPDWAGHAQFQQPQQYFDHTGSSSLEGSQHAEMYRFPLLEHGTTQAGGWDPRHAAAYQPAGARARAELGPTPSGRQGQAYTPTQEKGSSSSNETRKRKAIRPHRDRGAKPRSAKKEEEWLEQVMSTISEDERAAMETINRRLSGAVDEAEQKRVLLELGAEYFSRSAFGEQPLVRGKLDADLNSAMKVQWAAVQGSAKQMALIRKILEIRTERAFGRMHHEAHMMGLRSVSLEWNFVGELRPEDFTRNQQALASTGQQALDLEQQLEPFVLGDFLVRIVARDTKFAGRMGITRSFVKGSESDLFVSVFAVPKDGFTGELIDFGSLRFSRNQ